ncbi:MAG: hypothetical protein ACFE92_14370 [Promethearchaeota archaeon]
MNLQNLEDNIRKEIHILRNLGEHAREGSDHLYYRSISKFTLGKVKKVKYQEKQVFEIICKYDIYTETEFLHTLDMDNLYTEHYKDKFIFNNNFAILEVIDMRK